MELDREAVRNPPTGRPLLHQRWDKLLFMHWPFPESALRPLIPEELRIDTFGGSAWVGVTPFTMPVVRPAGLPALPVVGSTHELNVRTYVHRDGVPGVWFLSLDASNPLAVLGARLGFSLPYYAARMELDVHDRTVRITSRRIHPGAPAASFEASWRREEPLPDAQPGSLEFFLIERYCLYAMRGGKLLRARIHHDPWPLCSVSLQSHASSMLESHRLSAPDVPPLLHGQVAPLDVRVWAPEIV